MSKIFNRYSVRDFLGRLCKYPQLREIITPNLNSIASFLEANPKYGGIEEIEVDFNLIEVSPIPILTFDGLNHEVG